MFSWVLRAEPLQAGHAVLRHGRRELVDRRHAHLTVQIDCTNVEQSPSATVSRGMFDQAELWMVNGGLSLALQPQTGECSIYLIDGDNLRPQLVFFRNARFPR